MPPHASRRPSMRLDRGAVRSGAPISMDLNVGQQCSLANCACAWQRAWQRVPRSESDARRLFRSLPLPPSLTPPFRWPT